MADKKSGMIRKKRTYYAQVSNVALRDIQLIKDNHGVLASFHGYS